ncbi:ubiquitin-protein ligase (E3) [Massospora cicadina]|nr:ubiquitin-protein ligase (E3) [Massospora cicadina]
MVTAGPVIRSGRLIRCRAGNPSRNPLPPRQDRVAGKACNQVMWNFEGNAGSRPRQINLGGRVAAVTKEAILQRTREERRRRELERIRQHAAIKIQRSYRRKVESVVLKRGLRSDFDEGVESISKASPTWDKFYTLVCKLVAFFTGMSRERLEVPLFLLPLAEPSLGPWWSAVMGRFLNLTLQGLSAAAPDAITVMLWGIDVKRSSDVRDRDLIYQKVVGSLVSKGLFLVVGESVSARPGGTELLRAVGLLLTAPNLAPQSSEMITRFHLQLFSRISFSEALTSDGATAFFNTLPIWQLLGVLHQLLTRSQGELVNRCSAVSQNLAAMEPLVLEQASSGELALYFRCLQGVLALAIPEDYARDDNGHSDALSVQNPSELELGGRMFMARACGVALARASGPEDPLLDALVKYCTHLLVGWPQLEEEVLGNLLYGHSGLRRGLVPVLCERALVSAHTLDFGAAYLLIRLLLRQLEVLGDNPMVGDTGQELLTPPQARALIPALGDCLFGMYWGVTDATLLARLAGQPFTTKHFRHSATALLRQIHEKNSRFQFLPAGVWSEPWATLRQDDFAVSAAHELFQLSDGQEDEVEVVQPRVAILRSIPFIVPFDIRVDIFSRCIALERERVEVGAHIHPREHIPADIRRDKVFEDGFTQLNPLGSALKKRVSITLYNHLGMPEAGIDGGGVFKEFLNALIQQAFDPQTDLFLHTSEQLLYPSPHRANREYPRLRQYEFIGRMVGKALFEGILIDASFARFFLSKWLGHRSFLDDLPSLDAELYAGLMSLLRYDGDPDDLALNFTLVDPEPTGPVSVELVRGGERLPVTAANRVEYVRLVADYRLNTQLQRQSRAFLGGLADILPPLWLQMFDPAELQMVISGGRQPIDVAELRANFTYSGVYHPEHPTILAFWEVVHRLAPDALALLLKFVTSCSRPPLLGFKALSPPLCIRDAGTDDGRLPTASTCVNLLKLPIYSSRAVLEKKLMYAIRSESGFELS